MITFRVHFADGTTSDQDAADPDDIRRAARALGLIVTKIKRLKEASQ